MQPIKRVQQFFKKSFTFSQLQPSWTSKTAHWNEWTTERAINEGYKSSTYVFACINAISKASASVPWKVYRKSRQGVWEEIQGHPLAELIERPNPFSSRKDLIERMTANLYLGGNAYFSKVRAGGAVVELWNLPADAMKVVPSKQDFIDHYLYEANGVKEKILPVDLLHNMFIDPANPYIGMSPLQAGAKAVDTDVEAVGWNKIALQNRAITDGAFTFEQPLTRDQWEEARAMVREQHQGAENARTPWVLGAGAKWTQMSLSPAEMDFIESRRFTRSEICSIFQVPPPIVGIYDDATLANIETARKIFWLDTIIPYLEDIKNCFNQGLTPEFGQDIEISYDVSNVEAIQTNFSEKLANAKQLWTMGVPFNDINQRLELGFDEVEGGEIGYLPTSVIPIGLELEDPAEPPATDPPADPNKDPNDDEGDDDSGTPPKAQKRPNLQLKTKKNSKTAEHLSDTLGAVKGLNLKTDEHKEFYWKAFERKRAMWYLAATRKSAQLFKKEGAAVAAAFKSGDTKQAIAAIDKHKKEWHRWLKATWQGIIEEVGKETFSNLKAGAMGYETKEEAEEEVEDFFNPWESTIQGYIEASAAEKVTWVSNTSKEEIRGIINTLRAENATLDEIAKAINEKYTDFSRYRSYRIARTEVVGASNYASIKSAEQSEVVTFKEWVSSHDDRVRESHENVHGEVVPLKEKFKNGLQFPADYSANKPAETIQCRCTIAYYTE